LSGLSAQAVAGMTAKAAAASKAILMLFIVSLLSTEGMRLPPLTPLLNARA